ncbi:MAG: C-GCAxxG-C-C family protein [Desulfobacterales bacterium]|jgi:C_GCAxxG_C_C family probable redox protein
MSTKKVIQKIELPDGDEWIARVRDRSFENMKRYDGCAQVIVGAFMQEWGLHEPLVTRSATAFLGGMLSSYTCGVHVAGLMVLGLLIGRENIEEGLDGVFPIAMPAQELIRRLNAKIGSHSCKELTGVDFTDLDQALAFHASTEHERCFTRVADGAEQIGLFIKELHQKGELFSTANI